VIVRGGAGADRIGDVFVGRKFGGEDHRLVLGCCVVDEW